VTHPSLGPLKTKTPAGNGVHLIPIHPLVHSKPNPRWQRRPFTNHLYLFARTCPAHAPLVWRDAPTSLASLIHCVQGLMHTPTLSTMISYVTTTRPPSFVRERERECGPKIAVPMDCIHPSHHTFIIPFPFPLRFPPFQSPIRHSPPSTTIRLRSHTNPNTAKQNTRNHSQATRDAQLQQHLARRATEDKQRKLTLEIIVRAHTVHSTRTRPPTRICVGFRAQLLHI
jgi:hypothetical protein